MRAWLDEVNFRKGDLIFDYDLKRAEVRYVISCRESILVEGIIL